MFDMKTSLLATRSSIARCPASDLRSSIMLRLLRCRFIVMPPMPGFFFGTKSRMKSESAPSTLTTSAPRSPRMRAAIGAITTVHRSTTRMPASGPVLSKDIPPRYAMHACCSVVEVRPASMSPSPPSSPATSPAVSRMRSALAHLGNRSRSGSGSEQPHAPVC